MNRDEIQRFVASTWNETDRGYVLMVAQQLSDLLDSTLRLVIVPGRAKELLDGKFAPMGTLSAKLELMGGLGLLPPDDWQNANTIRRIRNEFAHSTEPMTLETQSVKDRIASLSLGDEAEDRMLDYAKQVDGLLDTQPYRFLNFEQLHGRLRLDYVTGTILSAKNYLSAGLAAIGMKPQEGWLFTTLQQLEKLIGK